MNLFKETILYGEKRQATLMEEMSIYGRKLDEKVQCVRCGDEYMYNDVCVTRMGIAGIFIMCKNYPNCDGHIYDMMSTSNKKYKKKKLIPIIFPEEFVRAKYNKISEMGAKILVYSMYRFQQSIFDNPEQSRNILHEFYVREFCIDIIRKYNTRVLQSIKKAINKLSNSTFTLTDMDSKNTGYKGNVPFFDVIKMQTDEKISFKFSPCLIELMCQTRIVYMEGRYWICPIYMPPYIIAQPIPDTIEGNNRNNRLEAKQ